MSAVAMSMLFLVVIAPGALAQDATKTSSKPSPQIFPAKPGDDATDKKSDALAPLLTPPRSPTRAEGGAPLSDADRYRRGQNHFEFGDCEKVIDNLRELAVPGRLDDEDRLVETHRMLGICYFQLGKRKAAARELKGLLYIKPDYVLDPFLTPPPVVELFTTLRKEVKRKLSEINAANASKRPLTALVIEREVVEQETPLWTIVIPFGGAQVANGEPVKAVILGGLQAAAIVVNLAGFWTAQALWLSNPTGKSFTDENLWTIHEAARIVSYVGLASWALIYGYSVADAWWNWTPRKVIDRKESTREATEDDRKRLR